MNYNLLDDIKEKIRNDINNISIFSNKITNTISFTLNDDEILNNIVKDTYFKNKVREEIENNINEESEICLENISMSFENGDLLYSLHKASMKINALKNEEGIWDINVKIVDTYDFTDFKQLKEYTDNKNDILTDMLATTLNNFGVISSEYGVLKIYDLEIDLNFDSTKLYEEDVNER